MDAGLYVSMRFQDCILEAFAKERHFVVCAGHWQSTSIGLAALDERVKGEAVTLFTEADIPNLRSIALAISEAGVT